MSRVIWNPAYSLGSAGGSPIALRVGQSEVNGTKRASVSYDNTHLHIINWSPGMIFTLDAQDGTWIVATTSWKSLWQPKASETTWSSHQIYHWLSWVFTMRFPWLNLTEDFACETTAIKPSCARLGLEVMLYFSQQWEHNNSQPTQSTNLFVLWLLSLYWLHFSVKHGHKTIYIVVSIGKACWFSSISLD